MMNHQILQRSIKGNVWKLVRRFNKELLIETVYLSRMIVHGSGLFHEEG